MAKLDLSKESHGFNETEFRAFWCIDSAHPHEKDGHILTGFYSGAWSFYSPIKFKEFIEMINDQIKKN